MPLSAFQWGHEIILGLGIFTIVIGTLGTLKQTNVRRLISYGSIAYTGFLLPFAVLEISTDLFIWYAIIYALMNAGIFYAIGQFEKRGIFELSDYAGLGKSVPVMGVLMTVVLVALIGLPPTAGFTAKWFLFSSLWNSYQLGSDPFLLTYLLIGVFATAVALFYYLRVPYYMFLKSGESKIENPPVFVYSILSLIAILLLGFFFAPGMLFF